MFLLRNRRGKKTEVTKVLQGCIFQGVQNKTTGALHVNLLPLALAELPMLSLPVELLAVSRAVGCVPTAMIDGLTFTIVTLQ